MRMNTLFKNVVAFKAIRREINLQIFIGTISRASIFWKAKSNGNHDETELYSVPNNDEYEQLAKRHFSLSSVHSCFIIHPYIKWGSQKERDTNPEQQLTEAIALIRTLEPWKVKDSVSIPLQKFDKVQVFGTGNLDQLRKRVRSDNEISAVFVNVGTLTSAQLEEFENIFGVPIFDRYKIVMLILKLHAHSKHAQLQVALAEIPYLRANLKRYDTHFMASCDFDTKKLMLQAREQKLKNEIKILRQQRVQMRSKRQRQEFPTVAVVGYTNCGKTSLIKSLTGDTSLQPRNQLFATLDVTLHKGLLPSNLDVLYVDTVGFISNIPTNLIECFVATLEDAMFADVILHVEDLSTKDLIFQRKHVVSTLKNLSETMETPDMMNKIITIGNKSDISNATDYSGLKVSALTGNGLNDLIIRLEEIILDTTGRLEMKIRVPAGGDEIRWLYKNATVLQMEADEVDNQNLYVHVIITQVNLQKFKHYFVHSTK